MKSCNLEAEWGSAFSSVRQPHLDWLRALGVSPASIAMIGVSHPAFGVVEAEAAPGGLYQPGAGVLHVVNPVYECGDLIDLIAWRSDEPARWWCRTGLGWFLNADACLSGRWNGDLLDLHATPLDWMRAGANGVGEAGGVVLDWTSRELLALRGFETITCDDAWLAATVRRALSKPPRLPTIRERRVRHAAAA